MSVLLNAFSLLPRLETERLILRELTLRDTQDIYEYSSDPAVSRHVLWDTYQSPAQARMYIRHVRRQYRQGFPGAFAVELKDTHKVIGTIGFSWINPEHRSCEVGYSLNRRYWNMGYATEALSRLIRYAFAELHLNRIEAQCETDNPASGRVMEKAGMHYEGTLRQRLKNKGRFVDVKLYAILHKDFSI